MSRHGDVIAASMAWHAADSVSYMTLIESLMRLPWRHIRLVAAPVERDPT